MKSALIVLSLCFLIAEAKGQELASTLRFERIVMDQGAFDVDLALQSMIQAIRQSCQLNTGDVGPSCEPVRGLRSKWIMVCQLPLSACRSEAPCPQGWNYNPLKGWCRDAPIPARAGRPRVFEDP